MGARIIRHQESGQTLVEFVMIVPIFAAAIAGTFGLLRASAVRTECSRVVFESVHSVVHRGSSGLGQMASLYPMNGVTLRRSEEGVEGWKKCGSRVEHLFLPYLGKRKPGA